jgi:uncharacterized protein involved in exopolysaccharide biosynthesis
MNQYAPLTLKDIVQACWRRRWLLALPILVLFPLSLVYAKFSPKSYVTHALMQLQESGKDTLLTKEPDSPIRIQDRIAGLQALLKSDLVLTNSLREMLGDRTPTDPYQLDVEIKKLSDDLSLDLVGTDFLEFELKGSDPHGLGHRLETVLINFLEALLSEHGGTAAGKLLLERRKQELDHAEASFATLKSTIESQAPEREQRAAEVDRLKQDIGDKTMQMNAVLGQSENAVRALPVTDASTSSLDDQVNKLLMEAQSLATKGQAESADYRALEQRIGAIKNAQILLGQYESLRTAVAEDQAKLKQAELAVAEAAALDRRFALSQDELQVMREQYDSYVKRYTVIGNVRGGTILNAPEMMKQIDPPLDPQIPSTSSLRYVAIGFVASLVLAISLAVLAEFLDPTLRRQADFAIASGAPVIARLPSRRALPAPA